MKVLVSAAVIVVIAVIVMNRIGGDNPEPQVAAEHKRTVSLLSLENGGTSEPLVVSGQVEAAADVTILSEAAGTIQRINVNEDDEVVRGTVILELENADERIALAQAQTNLDTAQLTLSELNGENPEQDDSTLVSVTKQQDTIIANALRTLLNNDLRSYSDGTKFAPGDRVEDILGPTISGTYTNTEEGEYLIEVFASNAESGFSFRYSGLESGVGSGSIVQPVLFGNRGLQIQFPDIPKHEIIDTRWTVPIPNTRSTTYVTALNAYELAVEGKDLALKQTEVQPEALARQEAAVRSAKLSVDARAVALGKTILRSPIVGTVTELDFDQGDFVGVGTAVATVKSLDRLEIVAFISERDRNQIKVGGVAWINDVATGTVIQVSDAVDAASQKVKVRVAVDTLDVTEGENVRVAFNRVTAVGSGVTVVPLAALQVIGTDIFAMILDESGIARHVPVETGALQGDKIVITGGLDGIDLIVADARGISAGDSVDSIE